jgi:hypothetical protein
MAQPNIVDMRIYTIRPQGMPAFLKIFEEHGLPLQLKYLGPPVGYYTTEIGPLNQVVHMWGYESLADMEARRAARNADPAWQAYARMTEGFITAQETRIVKRVAFKALG